MEGAAWLPSGPCAVGVAVALAVLLTYVSLRKRPLPGKLLPKGSFVHEDPANNEAIAERWRDFSRIVATKRDIWIFTHSQRKPGIALPVDLPTQGNSQSQDTGKVAYQKLKFFLQGELGKIEGAIDLGMTSQWPVVDRVVYFTSASPGFDFLMQNRVPPMVLQAKFLIMVSKTGQVRAAWYAFVTHKPMPGATSGPFVVKLVSEDMKAERGSRTHTEFTYTATATRETDMERIISKHVPLIMKGVDKDTWDAYLRA